MLDDYRARNKPNNPPSAKQLLSIAKGQVGVDDTDNKDELDGSGSNNEGEGEKVKPRMFQLENVPFVIPNQMGPSNRRQSSTTMAPPGNRLSSGQNWPSIVIPC